MPLVMHSIPKYKESVYNIYLYLFQLSNLAQL